LARCEEQAQPLDEAPSGLAAALDVEAEDRAGALGQELLAQRMVGMIGQLGRGDALYGRIVLEEAHHLARILDMARHAQRQGLETLQQVERRLRRHARAEVAHALGAGAHDEGVRAELLGEVDA
jgi:hypothetical protein